MKNQLISTYRTILKSHESNPDFGHILEKRGFVFQYDEDEKESELVFVGINPSFDEKKEVVKLSDSYTREGTRGYFKTFSTIHEELEKSVDKNNYHNWTHLDLFVFRETNQKYIYNIMKSPEGCHFLMQQLEVAKQRLIHIAPKVVVVANSLARQFTGKDKVEENGITHGVWMGFEFKFDEEFGSHKVTNIPELGHTHFLFTSMLSGQRALDLGSRERLVWQVKRILRGN